MSWPGPCYEIISVLCGGNGPVAPGLPIDFEFGHVKYINNRDNHLTPCQAYQQALESSDPEDEILIYLHDDVEIFDADWLNKVLEPFNGPSVECVGLGGARSLGHPDLYKRPYELNLLARGGYRSNQRDWQVHGEHLIEPEYVAVCDAFFLAVRRSFLIDVGGWPTKHISHHGIDLWLACEIARAGGSTVIVPIDCMHYGGGTSVKDTYRNAKWLQGQSLETDHQLPHRWLYENYVDVLPLEVKHG